MAGGKSIKRYDLLDGMRGVAAICVMLMHTSSLGAYRVFQSASMAVDFFFILSGFVIAHSYGSRTEMRFSEFACRRVIRLYPMFLFGLLIGVPILFLYGKSGLTDLSSGGVISSFLFNIFYIPFFSEANFFNGMGGRTHAPVFPANDPSWSLFFEIVANLFFFMVFSVGRRRLSVFVGLAYLSMIGVGILLALSKGRLGWEFQGGWNTLNFVDGFPRVFYGFWMGMLLYSFVGDVRLEKFVRTIHKLNGTMYIIIVIIMLLMFSLPSFGVFSSVIYLCVVGVAAPILIYVGAEAPCGSRTALAVSRFLGWLSYPIYCVHFPIMRGVEMLSSKGYNFGVSPFFISSAASLIIAIVVVKIYDEPTRAWLTRKLLSGTAGRPVALEKDFVVHLPRS